MFNCSYFDKSILNVYSPMSQKMFLSPVVGQWWLNGAHPNGVHPNSAHPNGAHPNGAHPNSAYPNGAHPNGAHPNGAHPNGAHPNGAYPNGAHPNSAHPNSTHPNNAHPKGLPQSPPVSHWWPLVTPSDSFLKMMQMKKTGEKGLKNRD